jgi:rod shape determining protein RodA
MSRKINIWANLDWSIVLVYLFLLILGWISIYSALYDEMHSSIFDFSRSYGKQLIWIIAALFIAATIMMIDSRLFPFFSYTFYGFTILLLLAVLVVGVEINGQKAWFQFAGLQIQPAEFAKLATAMALSQFLHTSRRKIHDAKNLLYMALILFLPVMLIMLQPDAGSAIVFISLVLVLFREGLNGYIILFGGIFLVLSVLSLLMSETGMIILLVSGTFLVHLLIGKNIKFSLKALLIFAGSGGLVMGIFHLVSPGSVLEVKLILAALSGGLIVFLVSLLQKRRYAPVLMGLLVSALIYTWSVDYVFDNMLMPHQKSRINIVLGVEDDPLGQSYNINQSKIAIGSGGLTGRGFLQGTQTKFNFVPEQSTDFIFCTIGEEWGFAGSLFTISAFVFLLLRLVHLAERQRSLYARVYGYSLIVILFTHITINIGMTIGLVPVIGIPLPFISYGGSSLWAFTIMLFIFLRLDASRTQYLSSE